MIDERDLLERALQRFEPQPGLTDRVYRRREQKRRNQRIGAGGLAIILALVTFATLIRTFRTVERPADEPKPKGIFSEVGGWIAYGNEEGIWAVDPSHPGDQAGQIQLSSNQGTPLAWSRDGSKLLILRQNSEWQRSVRLYVLNADGTETHLTTSENYFGLGAAWSSPDMEGSFSPDGSQVIYANKSSIYVVDAQGGTPRVLKTASRRWFSVQGRRVRAFAYSPTYSPDGTQIAYFDGAPTSTEGIVHQLRVMNADGSGTRVLVDDLEGYRISNLAWSPDGERLAFFRHVPRWRPADRQGSRGTYIVGADGSDLTLVIPDGAYPYWSPDGSRIAYSRGQHLEIADADGKNIQEFGYARSGPWIPLPLSASGEEQPTATVGGSGAAPFVYAIAVLGAVGVLVIARRARRRIAAR